MPPWLKWPIDSVAFFHANREYGDFVCRLRFVTLLRRGLRLSISSPSDIKTAMAGYKFTPAAFQRCFCLDFAQRQLTAYRLASVQWLRVREP